MMEEKCGPATNIQTPEEKGGEVPTILLPLSTKGNHLEEGEIEARPQPPEMVT